MLALTLGEAHVIGNADGVVTDGAIRSLAISERLLGTTVIVLIHRTDCRTMTFTDDDVRRSIAEDSGIRPPWSAEAFIDAQADVRQSLARDRGEPVPAAQWRRARVRLRGG